MKEGGKCPKEVSMLEFELEADHLKIKQAFVDQKRCSFVVQRENTAFWNGAAPDKWTEYPIGDLPPDDISRIMVFSPPNIRGALTRFELLLSQSGARVSYRANGSEKVEVQFEW